MSNVPNDDSPLYLKFPKLKSTWFPIIASRNAMEERGGSLLEKKYCLEEWLQICEGESGKLKEDIMSQTYLLSDSSEIKKIITNLDNTIQILQNSISEIDKLIPKKAAALHNVEYDFKAKAGDISSMIKGMMPFNNVRLCIGCYSPISNVSIFCDECLSSRSKRLSKDKAVSSTKVYPEPNNNT